MIHHMGLPISKRRYTVDEYLRMERDSLEKHEFHEGEILAMAGNSPEHVVIATNLIGELHARLKGKRCRVYESNLRLRAGRSQRYVYPDLSVICGQPQFDPLDTRPETVTNPRILVEILSPTTEAYDRGEKFDRYREIDSLEEYLLVWQHVPRVELFRRQPDGTWAFSAAVGTDSTITLPALGIQLSLTEIYDGVTFPPALPEPFDDRDRN